MTTIGEASITSAASSGTRGSSTSSAGQQVGTDDGQGRAQREGAGRGADHDVGREEHQRPPQRVLREERVPAHTGQPGMEERGEPVRRRGEEAVAQRAGLPEVDRLVSVPRERGEQEVVRQDGDRDRGEREEDRRRPAGRRARVPHRSQCTRPPRARPDTAPGSHTSADTIPVRMTAVGTPGTRTVRTRPAADVVVLALLAYVPFLASSRGRLSSDTKQYLYLDPGRFLARVPWLWDPHVAAGTVPHQQIGYLFPMGPFFWVADLLGSPDWIAQRLWLGTISLAAGLGARWLFRRLGLGPLAAFAAALVYLLTPYQLAFTARISVLLLPWAALPWIVGLTMQATRRGGWRDPAVIALIVLTIGGVNASALVLVGLAPALWILLELFGGRVRARAALAATARVAVLSIGVSAWWITGLYLQGSRGLPILQLTENVKTVSANSDPGDILRGLGNWFFYGYDRAGPSVIQSVDYVRDTTVVVASYLVPALAFLAAGLVRWRHRAYFALCVVVGTVVGVGAWPYGDSSPWGALWKRFTSDTSAGLALRNSPRVVPVVVLGVAGLVGAGVSAIRPALARRLGALAVAVVLALAFLPVWRDGYLTPGVERPEDIPSVLDRRDPRPRRRRSPDPHPRDPRIGVRHLHLGQRGRADHARPHHAPLHRARGPARRVTRVVQPARRVRPPHPERQLRADRAGAGGPPLRHRDHRAAVGPRVRAFREPPPEGRLGRAHRPAARGHRRAPDLRPAGVEARCAHRRRRPAHPRRGRAAVGGVVPRAGPHHDRADQPRPEPRGAGGRRRRRRGHGRRGPRHRSRADPRARIARPDAAPPRARHRRRPRAHRLEPAPQRIVLRVDPRHAQPDAPLGSAGPCGRRVLEPGRRAGGPVGRGAQRARDTRRHRHHQRRRRGRPTRGPRHTRRRR